MKLFTKNKFLHSESLDSTLDSQDDYLYYLTGEAMREYIERETARISFKRETEQAWEHYQQTGLHVTEAEMNAWMDSMYTDNEKSLPVCHK